MRRTSRFPQLGDAEIVLAALLGDFEALDELVRRFRGAVTLVAEQALGRREGAEDVAQEAFLIAFKALPQLQEPSKFPAWLCAITRHRARRVARREGRAEPREPSEIDRLLLAQSRELSESPAETVEKSCESARIREALSRLEPDYRMVLRLRYAEEWSVARIADFLSLPITTVKWRLHHGRELLRRRLTQQQREEPFDGRGNQQHRGACAPPPDGTAPPAPSAPRDRRARAARESDGQPVAGRAQRGASVQSDRRAS